MHICIVWEKDIMFSWIDSSLDDIKYVLNPTFTKENISILDITDKVSRSCDGTLYRPGVVGLNNIKANDYCNVVLQVMKLVVHVKTFKTKLLLT